MPGRRTGLTTLALVVLVAASGSASVSANDGTPAKKQAIARKYAAPKRCNGCPPPFAPDVNARKAPQDGVKTNRFGGLKERPIPQ